MKRGYKIKFTDKSKANLWIYLDLAKVHRLKGLTSPYIISYLHFLNLNNILALSQTLVIAQDGFFFFFSCVGTKAPPAAKMPWGLRWVWLNDTNDVRLVCCLPDLRACIHGSLQNQNKCKPSMFYV